MQNWKTQIYFEYKNEEVAEQQEKMNKIPNLIKNHSFLSNLDKKWYPIKNAISNILNKKQNEWNKNHPEYWSISNMVNWDLRFDGKKFEWKIWYKNLDDKTNWKKSYVDLKPWQNPPDSIWVTFSYAEVQIEMKSIFLQKQKIKLALLDNINS